MSAPDRADDVREHASSASSECPVCGVPEPHIGHTPCPDGATVSFGDGASWNNCWKCHGTGQLPVFADKKRNAAFRRERQLD